MATGKYIYRMVHWQNIPHILQYGLCCRTHQDADPNYINIGHRQLINDRDQYHVDLDGAGVLGDYIPFYFAGHSPMLLLIMSGRPGVIRRPQEDLVFVVCRIHQVSHSGIQYFFTDRNAKIKLARLFTEIGDLDKLHWDSINSRYWKNTEENSQQMDLKQAEFLVKHHLPRHLINAIVVRNKEKKAYIEEQLLIFDINIPVYIDNGNRLYYP
jgi:hypothetical protein